MDKNSHKIEMTDRRELNLSGITEVKEFTDSRIVLKTVMGNLNIRGRRLTMSRLNTDEGTLEVSGEIDILRYSGSAGGGVIEGLFK